MLPLKYTTRRIQKAVADIILKLQQEAFESKGADSAIGTYAYNEHLKWLKRAVDDIQAQTRVGFASYYQPDRKDSDLEKQIVGSIIIKKNEYTSVIELKNIFIYEENLKTILNDDFLNNKSDLGEEFENQCGEIRQKLIQKVERFCQKRGFYALEVEIPDDDDAKVRTFLTIGYQVIATRRSKYITGKKGNYIYILRKELIPSYIGDPYDFDLMTPWFLGHIMGFLNIQSGDFESISLNLQFSKLSFEFIPPSILSRKALLDPLKGICAITENEIYDLPITSKQIDKIFHGDHVIKLLIVVSPQPSEKNNDKLKRLCAQNGVYFISREALYDSLGGLFRQKTTLKKEDIQALMLEVDPDFKARVEQRETTFIYPLLNGIGSTLIAFLTHKSEEDNFYLFYYTGETTGLESGIWGYSLIQNAYPINLDELVQLKETEFKNKYLFNKEEFLYYSTYYTDYKSSGSNAISNGIVCLVLEKPEIAAQTIDIEKMASPRIKENIKDNLEYANLNNIYLDFETVENILKTFKPTTIPNTLKPEMQTANKLKKGPEELKADATMDTKPNPRLPKVVILTAIKEEYAAVRAHLTNVEEVNRNDTSYECGIFLWSEKPIAKIVIRECGAKNINSSQETERAIQYFKPNTILFVGIAGSRKPRDFSLGDVIFPEKIYSYEGGKSGKEAFMARPDLSVATYTLFEIAKKERRKDDWRSFIKGKWDREVKANLGNIASGEQIIDHYDSKIGKILSKHYDDTHAVEMEGFGFAKAATRQGRATSNILVGVVRGISDILDSSGIASNVDQRPTHAKQFASDTAAAFAFCLIYKIYEPVKK